MVVVMFCVASDNCYELVYVGSMTTLFTSFMSLGLLILLPVCSLV
jgi:hypothetical protein